eukprot:scaffold4238_cov105-Isochrysis_galbana.AAC.6
MSHVGSIARAPSLQASSAGRSVIIYMRFVRFLRPHTMIPLPWRETGIQFSQHESKHTSQAQAHGDEARKAQGGGKRSLHLVFRGRWISARGLPTPLSGA